MIAVFLPSTMLMIFTCYSFTKTLTLNMTLDWFMYMDFGFWNLLLVVPAVVAVIMSAITISQGRTFCNQMGKFINYCGDGETLQRVRV